MALRAARSMTHTIFHPLDTQIEPPRQFTYPFHYTPHPLTLAAAAEVQRYLSGQPQWAAELRRGKMFGVLVVRWHGRMGFLAAYSGLLGERCDWPYFVPPVYDSQRPDGHFKTEEAAISALNRRIADMERDGQRQALARQLDELSRDHERHLILYKEQMAEAKRRRDALRPTVTDAGRAAMVRESQFMKAELVRLKRRQAAERDAVGQRIAAIETAISDLKAERKRRSDQLQQWLFSQFVVSNARGERRHLVDIFARTVGRMPPSGAGDCCAPRLLQCAYAHGMDPLCMGEFWWGESPRGEVRHHLHYYPACRGKCLPILTFMLQGLDVEPNPLAADDGGTLRVVDDNAHYCVVVKPAGMLSVPGRTGRRSVVGELRHLWPDGVEPLVVHRLDMDTSGLLLVAKSRAVQVALQAQFATRRVGKRYVALLDGEWHGAPTGTVSLPLRPDPLDRPRQVVDPLHGKPAVTTWRVRSVAGGRTLVELTPHTGRTHQLRVHCAHSGGLGLPIVGDALYGHPSSRLFLHAERLSFLHPVTGQRVSYCAEPDPAFFSMGTGSPAV